MEQNLPAAPLNVGIVADATRTFLPTIAVCYLTSKAFETGIAKVGEFVFGGQTSLGKPAEFVVLDFRAHVAQEKADYSFETEEFHLSTDTRKLEDNPEFMALKNKKVEQGRIVSGMDMLLYSVSQNAVGVLFMKSSLAKFATPIINASIKDMKLKGNKLSIDTVPKEKNGKKWYDLIIQDKGELVKIDPAMLDKGIKMFRDIPLTKSQANRGTGSYENNPANAEGRVR
jgi:hypothetical protein